MRTAIRLRKRPSWAHIFIFFDAVVSSFGDGGSLGFPQKKSMVQLFLRTGMRREATMIARKLIAQRDRM
jgi:hypothetical protein